MSALGQKQTYALQKAMSALTPVATAKAYSRKRSCPLYPRKRIALQESHVTQLFPAFFNFEKSAGVNSGVNSGVNKTAIVPEMAVHQGRKVSLRWPTIPTKWRGSTS